MPSPGAGPSEWRLFDTAEAVAEHAADWLCSLACSRDGDVAICLSGGSTPQRFYQLLASAPVLSRMPWNRIHWFWGDERFVAHDDAASNYRMAHEALFSRVPVSQDHIHPIPTEGLSPQQAAETYQALLQRFYGSTQFDVNRPIFEVTLLGVGKDGHTASLFPNSSALREDRKWACAVFGEKSQIRVTLTFPTLNSSRNVAFLVTGRDKQKVLAQIRAGDRSTPATRIQPAASLYWFADRAAVPEQESYPKGSR
jgi:6-phosphogluconolactonase